MNKDTGEIRRLTLGENPKPNEILVNEPNPSCRRCKGRGAILDGNRKQRREVIPSGSRRYSNDVVEFLHSLNSAYLMIPREDWQVFTEEVNNEGGYAIG